MQKDKWIIMPIKYLEALLLTSGVMLLNFLKGEARDE
jgi:hypothetical protein